MKYTYLVHRDVWIDVEIEAEDEDAADEAYSSMVDNGGLNDRFRDEVLESDTEVAEVWEGGYEGICIYRIY